MAVMLQVLQTRGARQHCCRWRSAPQRRLAMRRALRICARLQMSTVLAQVVTVWQPCVQRYILPWAYSVCTKSLMPRCHLTFDHIDASFQR